MGTAVRALFLDLNSKILTLKQTTDVFIPLVYCRTSCSPLKMVNRTSQFHERVSGKQFLPVQAVSSGVEDVEVSSSEYEEFSITATGKYEVNELKISVEVSGTKTQEMFDDVFSKMVAAAQPIPGFRRVKGGKTPDIPRDILLEVLGLPKCTRKLSRKKDYQLVKILKQHSNLGTASDSTQIFSVENKTE